MVKAAPYASGITNNNGTIQFYLNENGGTAVVTYEDGSTNVNFDGQTTGLNLPSGQYSFSLGSHTTYSVAVTKFGSGSPGLMSNVIQATNTSVFSGNNVLQGFGDPRGLAVNVNPLSPYFGRIYISRGGASAGQELFYDLNPDGSWSTAGALGSTAGVTTWVAGSPYSSPDKISLAANDDLVVGDYSQNNAGVWLVDPNLVTNELLLGPIGDANGIVAGVHGAEVGPPVLLGNITNGATLLTIDGDLNVNRLEVYSNITLAALSSGTGWQTPPNLTGPQVAVDLPENPNGPGYYFFPSLDVGTNGYLYSGEYRSGVGSGDYAFVQVYDATFTNQLWNSRYNSGSSDYFFTKATGGSAQSSPTSVSVSPDGKYLATVAMDNHLTICLLTNGVPNVATISTIAPVRFGSSTSDGADEVVWDAADNLYVLSASDYGVTAWTLGQSATWTTFGNANGATGLASVSLTPTISVYATNPPVISQINSYGNPTNGTFTIIRTGPSGATMTVNFTYSGTAPSGSYTAGSSGSVVLQPGQTVTNISVAAVSGGVPRLTTYLTLNVSSSMNYIVGSPSATISILNTVTPQLSAVVGQSSMYNAFSNDYCSVVITRLGDTNTTETLSTYPVSGTAVEGADYTTPTTVTFNPGDLTQTAYVYPLAGGQIPTHNPNLPYTGNKTAIIALGAVAGYTVTTNTATLTIVDSAYPPATVLYSNPLTNSLDATNWSITAASGDLDSQDADVDVEFGCNLYNTPNYPVPPPPSGATNALKVTVNKGGGPGPNGGPMTAVNLYLTNFVASGNYAVRFNMNVLQGDSTAQESGSFDAEEGPLFGIDTSGMETNWWAGDTFALGDSQTNFAADGIWYWVSDNGGRYDDTFGPYLEFTGIGGALPNNGWTNLAIGAKSTFATAFKTNVFTSYASINVPPFQGGWTEGGPGLPANGPASLVGSKPNAWSDVEIKQMGSVVSMWIDKNRVFAYTNPAASTFTNGLVMLGYEDPFNGGDSPDTAVYYSNLRVVALAPPAISAPALNSSTGKFTFDFTSSDGDLTSSSFTVLGSTNVVTGYSAVSGATVTQLIGQGLEEFQATVPASTAIHFYRVQQK
ncbi:MAG TPA: Calx-beta domain-containing protein [Verrucomicrobiae bacterium]